MIASKVDVAALLSELDIRVTTDAGDWVQGICPFHEDTQSSFSIAVRENQPAGQHEPSRPGHWRCFACNISGDVVMLWCKVRNVSMRQAAEDLAHRYGVEVKLAGPRREKKPDGKADVAVTDDDAIAAAEQALALNEGARDWLRLNGIGEAVLRRYRLGLSDDRIVISVWNEAGDVVVQQKRHAFLDVQRALEPKSRGTAGATTWLYPSIDFRRDEESVICEGELDALILRGMGFNAVTMTGGVNSFRAERAKGLLAACPSHVIMIDQDDVGLRARARYVDELRKINPAARVRIAHMPLSGGVDQKDVRDLYRLERVAGHDPAELFARVVRDAVEAKPLIDLTTANVPDCVDQAIQAMLRSGAHVFVRGRQLVRVARTERVKDKAGQAVIEPLPRPSLREMVSASATCIRFDARGTPKPAVPPDWLVDAAASRGAWPFPPLTEVLASPALRTDGTVVSAPGYDQASGCWLELETAFPPVPDRPSREDAIAALDALFDPFAEFPFVESSDQSVVLAALLTLLARPAIDGPCPLFAIRAPTPGVGKSLLASLLTTIAMGRAASALSPPKDLDETRKLVHSVALEGRALVVLDNVVGALGSGELSAAITATAISGRVLGQSRLADAPLRAVWLVTGNNVQFQGDLGRRVLVADVDPKVERPEERAFRVDDILAVARADRGRLVSAGLTALRAHAVAGRPRHSNAPMGSFESWDRVVRSALVWAGMADPCGTRERVRARDDQDRSELRQLVGAWHDLFGEESAITVAQAVQRVTETLATLGSVATLPPGDAERLQAARTLHEQLVALNPKGGREPSPRAVGRFLAAHRGRIVDGLVIDQTGETKRAALWWIHPTGGAATAPAPSKPTADTPF